MTGIQQIHEGHDLFDVGSEFLSAIQADALMQKRAGLNPFQAFVEGSKKHVDSMLRRYALDRQDAAPTFAPGASFHLNRELEHSLNEVLREKYEPMNSFRLFTADTSTPPGATSVHAARLHDYGEAGFYRRGKPIPMVGNNKQDQAWPVRYAVAGFGYSLFERLSSDFANSNMVAENMRTCREILMRFVNWVNWFGNEAVGMYGITNSPYMPRYISSVAFNDTSSPIDILNALLDAASYPETASKGTYKPNACVMSPRLRKYVFNRDKNSVSASDKSIGQVFVERQEEIDSVDSAAELQGTGPGSTDGILIYRKDRMGIERVQVGGVFNALPPQDQGMETIVPCWCGTGGIRMRDPGTNVLMWVTPPS